MKIFLHLKSTVTDCDGESDVITHSGNGMLIQSGPLYRLSFSLNGVMQTLVFDPTERAALELQRGGDRMLFDTRLDRTEGRYQTEYVTLFPTVMTHRLDNALTLQGGTLHLAYTLDIGGQLQHFSMEIEVSPAP